MISALLTIGLVTASAPVDTTVIIDRGTRISVEGGAGMVVIRGHDGDEVIVEGGEAHYRSGELSVEANDLGSGKLTVTLPRWAETTVESFSGSVEVASSPESMRIETFAGNVTVVGGMGELVIVANAGVVDVSDFVGESIDIESVAGAITLRAVEAAVNVLGVNARVELHDVESSSVSVGTTNGAILWRGSVRDNARIELGTHNGGVRLVVPPLFNARVRVRTFRGSLTSQIEAASSNAGGRRRSGAGSEQELESVFGSGAATIEISTFMGGVVVSPLGES